MGQVGARARSRSSGLARPARACAWHRSAPCPGAPPHLPGGLEAGVVVHARHAAQQRTDHDVLPPQPPPPQRLPAAARAAQGGGGRRPAQLWAACGRAPARHSPLYSPLVPPLTFRACARTRARWRRCAPPGPGTARSPSRCRGEGQAGGQAGCWPAGEPEPGTSRLAPHTNRPACSQFPPHLAQRTPSGAYASGSVSSGRYLAGRQG